MSLIKKILILFFVGFFLGPIGDYSHVITDTTAYPQGVFDLYLLGIPIWVPFLFGSASLAVGISHPQMDKLLGPRKERPGAKNWGLAIGGLWLFLGIYILSGYLPWSGGIGNDLVLGGIAYLIWIGLDRSWQGIFLGLLTALGGTFVEIILVKLEVFSYLAPKDTLLGVASWLPWLYFSASVTIGNFGRKLNHV